MTTVNKTTAENNVKKVFKYKKRPGTSAIIAFLYRSHLIGIILCRNRNEETEFVLGCNVDEIGTMNELCFRFHHKDNKGKPVAVFLRTKYTGHITDDDLTNPKSAINLYQCNRSRSLIKERFDNNPDALFQGKFDSIAPYFVLYTPYESKIKNHVAITEDDNIYADKVNTLINTGFNSKGKIFKVQSSDTLTESLANDLINAKIEIIGKTIIDYVTSNDREKSNKEMKRVLIKYGSLLIPDVIEIDVLNEQCKAKFNASLHANSNSQIKLLREVLFTELLKKSKIIDEEASNNIQLLLETNEDTIGLVSKLIGTVITFNEHGKLVYMPGVSDSIKSQSLDDIKLEKSIADEAFVVAGMNALKCIEINLKDVDVTQIIQTQDDEVEQKKTKSIFENEIQLTESFFNHLYVYTEQVQEKNVDKRLQEEIIKIKAANNNVTISPNKPEEARFKFHYKVLEWMQYRDKSHYLTNNSDIWEDITVDLSFLNYNCIIELQWQPIMFNNKSLTSLSKLNLGTKSRTNIVSNNILLTSIKLMQCISDKKCTFINFDHVCNMKIMKFNMLIQDVKITTAQTLVIIFYETDKHTTESDKFKQIVNTFPGDVVAVSNKPIEDFETVYDTLKGLDDLYNPHELLTYGITVQGEEVELGKILDRNTVNLVSAEVLEKIIKKESIEIGKRLYNLFYDEIKDCFADRKLSKYNCYSLEFRSDFYMSSYNCEHLDLRPSTADSSNTLIAIYAEPGMGKSILLTHLSIKMKREYPKTWIVNMNLLNYSEDFSNWVETDVDIIKSMHLVCRAELNHKAFDNLFALGKGSEDELVLIEPNELDPITTLHLKLLIHCFNSGNIIFFFDGFDEICPYYLDVVIQFLKNIANIDTVDNKSEYFDSELPNANEYRAYFLKEPAKKNQVLLTSRPYNNIITTLKTELNIKTLYLVRLTREEQYNFYIKYWETRIKLEELSSDQFQNVEAFFKHANQYRRHADLFLRSTISNNMLLRRMQEAAIYFFRIKARLLTNGHIYKKSILSGWPLSVEMLNQNNADDECLEELQLSGIPLHMKIHADIFVNQIKATPPTKQWDMTVHTFEFYNRYLEIKLKKIRFEQKVGENILTSTSLTGYKNLKAEVIEEHKKLAFYAFFQEYGSIHYREVLPKTQWLKIESIIERITEAKEKTGLIDRIHNGVPRFVHVIFAEYYAVEYIADMLKKRPLSDEQVYRQIDFIVNCVLKTSVGVMTAFNYKLMNDGKLRKVLDKNYSRECIFTAWMNPDISSMDNKKTKTLLKKILKNGFIEIAWLMLKSVKDMLNSANLEKFIDLIGNDFFELAIKFDDLVKYVLDIIRRIDPSIKALSHYGFELRDLSENELIINNLRERYTGLALRRA